MIAAIVLEIQRAVVLVDDPARDGQAEPRAFALPRVIGAIEPFEDAFALTRLNAWPHVDDAKHHSRLP